MIIRHVTFTDFGVYGGTQRFDLVPTAEGTYDRPVVLFHGKNGVGKTSFVEAIRIALHGPLALGRRVSQRRYHEHLRRRIHRPAGAEGRQPDCAATHVTFDFVRGGRPHRYEVTRRWRLAGAGIAEEVEILEDGDRPEGVAPEQYDAFLRELVPASASDLFFFDGEKIDRLIDDSEADAALADAVERLLGLNLVYQLSADLDVYIARGEKGTGHTEEGASELKAAQEERNALAAEGERLTQERDTNREAMAGLRAAIDRQEQDLASKGGAYAKKDAQLKRDRVRLKAAAEQQRQALRILAGGLLPFATAPGLCQRVLARMDLEARFHQQEAAQALLGERRERLAGRLAEGELWKEVGVRAPAAAKRALLAKLLTDLLVLDEEEGVDPEAVFLHVSEHDRTAMTGQLHEALGTVAAEYKTAAGELDVLEGELEQTERELAMVPADLILQPLAETLQGLRAEWEERQQQEDRLSRELGTAEYKLGQAESKVARVKEELERWEQFEGRLGLAVRAQRAVEAYAEDLRAQKLKALSEALANRFNALCRKRGMLSGARVDPATYAITLFRDGNTFSRTELSAGEKQLFAVATLWALREVAGLPMPVIVDTPLGRLDSDHRLAMTRTFFPQVAHQVILLATDTEVDDALAAELAPSVSHGYRLAFDVQLGRTQAERITPEELVALPEPESTYET